MDTQELGEILVNFDTDFGFETNPQANGGSGGAGGCGGSGGGGGGGGCGGGSGGSGGSGGNAVSSEERQTN